VDTQNNVKWLYPTGRLSMDRSVPGSLLERGSAHELTGVDGSVTGGVKPFPGFQIAHEFDVVGWGSNHATSSEILEVFPISFLVGETGYGFGFVYRVSRKGTSVADIFFDYWESVNGAWTRSVLVKAAVAIDRKTQIDRWKANPTFSPDDGRSMSVVVWGRLVYVFLEGSRTVRVVVEEADPTNPVVSDETGPGIQPICLSEDKNTGSLGSIVSTGDANRPGKGQVFLTQFYPSETGLSLGQDDEDVRSLEMGDYAVAYLLQNSRTGLRSGLSEVAQIRGLDFDLDGTGSGTYVSEANLALEICYNEEEFDRALIYRSVRTQVAGGTYVAGILHLEAVVDLETYQSAATAVPPLSGNGFAQSIYFFEKDDKQLVFQETFEDRVMYDEQMPKGGVALWYDGTMLVTNIRDDSVSSSISLRVQDVYVNMGLMRWSSLTDANPELFPAENRYMPPIPNCKVVAMRRVGPNVVGFTKDRQFLTRKEGGYLRTLEMHEGYGVVNERAVDSVGSLIYFVCSSGVKAVSSEGQLDDVAGLNEVVGGDWKESLHSVSLAHDAVLSALFIHNDEERETYVLWFNTSRVTRIEDARFRTVSKGPWPSGFIWDPSLSTGGAFNKSYRGDMVERAFFLQNPVKNSAVDAPARGVHRLWIVDDGGVRTQKAGLHSSEKRRTLLDYTGSSTLRVQANFTTGNAINLSSGATSTITNQDMTGCCLHVLKAQNTALEGKRSWIRDAGTASAIELESATSGDLHGLVVGDVVAVSPVVVRWVGTPLWTPFPGNPQYGEDAPFQIKRADVLGVLFAGVQGLEDQILLTPANYWALLYKGDEAEPRVRNAPRGLDGLPVTGIIDGEPILYGAAGDQDMRTGFEATIVLPGVEIRQPDVDFRILSMLVVGSALPSERSRRAGQ